MQCQNLASTGDLHIFKFTKDEFWLSTSVYIETIQEGNVDEDTISNLQCLAKLRVKCTQSFDIFSQDAHLCKYVLYRSCY